MSVNKFLEELSKPFDAKDVKWRLQGTNADKTGGCCIFGFKSNSKTS